MNFCPRCGAPLSLLSKMLDVLHCRRGHHWTTAGRELGTGHETGHDPS